MKKKFLASLLTLCMVLTLLPTAALAETPPADPPAAPTVVSATPDNWDVPLSGDIVVTFDKAMNKTVGTATLKVGGGPGVPIEVVTILVGTWSEDGTVYTAPYQDLEPEGAYLVLLQNFQSADGVDLPEYEEQEFSTVDAPKVLVNGVNIMTDEDHSVQCGDTAENKAVYDGTTKTLTLTNATITEAAPHTDSGGTEETSGIFANGPLNIVLEGNNKIEGNGIQLSVYAEGALSFSGSGALEATTADDSCIVSDGGIDFTGGSYHLKTAAGNGAVKDESSIIVGTGVTLVAEGGTGSGLLLSGTDPIGTVTIQNGANVTAKGGYCGINAEQEIITVEAGASLYAQRTEGAGGALLFTNCTFGGEDYVVEGLPSEAPSLVIYQNGAFTELPTEIWVNGENIMDGATVEGVTFDGGITLTLDGAVLDTPHTISHYGISEDSYIHADGILNLIATGENTVTMDPDNTNYSNGICAMGALNITGDGKLSIQHAAGGKSSKPATGICAFMGDPSGPDSTITISDVDLDVKIVGMEDDAAIYSAGNVTLTDTTGMLWSSTNAIDTEATAKVNGEAYTEYYTKVSLESDGYTATAPLWGLKLGGVAIVKDFLPVEDPVLDGILTEGSYSFDESTATLTLTDATIVATDDADGIEASGPLTVNAVGANSISATYSGDGISSPGALTLSGGSGATLAVSAARERAYCGDVIDSDGTLTLSGGLAVTADGGDTGLYGDDDVTIGEGVTLHATNSNDYGIESEEDVTIADGATVAISGTERGIDGKNVTIAGTVTIDATRRGIRVSMIDETPAIAITGGTTTITTAEPDGIAILATCEYDEVPFPDTIVPVEDVLKFADGALPATHALDRVENKNDRDIAYAVILKGGTLAYNENDEITGGAPSVTLTVTVDVTAIDTAIAAADLAKTEIAVNENEPSAVDSGTKFVNAAELKALTDAIQTATDAKDTVRSAREAAAAAAALDTAVSTFQAAIKTGTYVPSTGNPRPVPKPEPPKTDAVTGNTEVSVSVKPSTKGDTSSATVPDKSIQNAIASAEKEAEKTGGSSSVTVSVDAPEGAKTVETTLPSKSLTAVADGKTEGLKISTPVADLSFDDEALKNIAALAGKDVKISASQVDTDGLTDAQKKQVGDAPVFDFTVTSDGKTISDFGGGTATVTVPYTPKDGENPEFVTVWLLDDAGKLIPIEAKYADGKITFTTGHFSRYAIGYLPFTDVKAGWSYESIVYAYQNKLFAGVGENRFAPDANMNRAMLWSVLYRMAGSPDKAETPATWYADAQKWVIANGISDGANPEGNVTREQLATILFRYQKATAVTADMSKFTDTTDISEFAKDGMTWAVETQILQGSEGKLNPQGTATRAEVATMLQRFAGISK